VNGPITDYTLHGKQVVHMKKGADSLHFFYDAEGRPSMIDHNGSRYGLIHNLQGDVIAIIDATGTIVVEYTYDAWGKPLTKTGTLATTLGTLNPFRYRGYVYDEETGLYYLRSRYYNPDWGRFVNGDATLGETGQLFEHNIITYCRNNPIVLSDSNGYAPNIAYMQAMTALHNEVVVRVADEVHGSIERSITGISGAGRKGGYGYPDVVIASIYAWEIKPYTPYGLRTGTMQISKYTDDTWYAPGYPVTIPDFEWTLLGVDGMVKVINGCMATGDRGVVYYSFIPNSTRDTQRQGAPSFRFLDVLAGALLLITLLTPVPGYEALAAAFALAVH